MADAAGRDHAAFYANLKAQLGDKSASDLLDELNSKLDGMGEGAELTDEEIKAYMDLIDELEPEPENPAFEAFTQNYIDRGMRSVSESDPVKPHRSFRRTVILIAAVIGIILVTTIGAYSEDMWNAIVHADGDIMHVKSGKMVLDEPEENGYHSLGEALEAYDAEEMAPTWVPEEFAVQYIDAVEAGGYSDISSIYMSENGDCLVIRVMVYHDKIPDLDYEIIKGTDKEYISDDGRKSIIAENNGQYSAIVEEGRCYCSIAGDISEEQLKQIIDSIGER